MSLSLCFQCFIQLGVVGWYVMNEQTIADKYCVNKDKPQLHCNGKCHLKKQLDKTGQGTKDQNKVDKTEWTVFILPQKFYAKTFFYPIVKSINISRHNDYSFLFIRSVFHPPQMC
ncbi:MAG TPA: hypothetical protein VL093_06795 [Flavipsychrobacter sp.]|nr:hypothetical protein [Flavipsychrobacter sp.]